MKDCKIVLTADRSFISDYHSLPFLRGLRFASASILNPSVFFRFVSPSVPTTDKGVALLAPYHTRRTEAALLNSGFNRNQVVVVTPNNICNFVGPNTKIVSITVRDPLSKIHHYSLLNPARGESYSSLSFKKLAKKLHSLRLSKKYCFKVVAEGPGAWQLIDWEDRRRFGVDYIIVGEYVTNAVPQIFNRIINSENSPEIFQATCTDINDVPPVQGGVTEGLVEVAKGCNRHCRFCTASKLQCRPLRDIVTEVKRNVKCGQLNITLRSDDILNYGARGTKLNREAVLGLYEAVKKLNGVKRVGQCYLSLASAVSEPSLIKEITHVIGAGCRDYPYTTVLAGIESGSPRLIEALMPGKIHPFKSSEWPEVVESGFSICNDNHWIPLGMLILGLPGETEEDVSKTITLVERLKAYKSVLVPFLFDAKGSLNCEKSFHVKDMKRRHLELVKTIFNHNTHWANRLIKEQASNMSRLGWLFPMISPFVDWGVKRAYGKLFDEIATTASPIPFGD